MIWIVGYTIDIGDHVDKHGKPLQQYLQREFESKSEANLWMTKHIIKKHYHHFRLSEVSDK